MLDIVHYVVSTNVINDFEWEADKVDQAGEQYIYIYYKSDITKACFLGRNKNI